MKRIRSEAVFRENQKWIAGGVVSLNRLAEPRIAFAKANGSHLWDVDGNEYIDYHGAFAPFILGHNDEHVNDAVRQAMAEGHSLFGSGTTELEGKLARLLVEAVPSIELVQVTNTGSEATYHALRIARAHTGRDHVIVMQGGYNGWHNDVAFNLMTPLQDIGEHISPGEYPKVALSAGIPGWNELVVHPVNFNDAASVEYVMRRYPVAAVILEPVLQNVGVVPPQPGYLQELRRLCDRHGSILIFDEVKTGFRSALGGYQSICGVLPDLTVLGKALANGYPLGAIGGKAELMAYFTHPDPAQRVMIAGTYNAHPWSVAAAIATIERLSSDAGAIYRQLEGRTRMLTEGVESLFRAAGWECVISRNASAFCVYFMDRIPKNWHDIALHHNTETDTAYRRLLIDHGVYHFPLATKQGSVSSAHTEKDIAQTLDATKQVLRQLKSPSKAG